MKIQHAGLTAVALAAILSLPAFAQGTAAGVGSSAGASGGVSGSAGASGTGVGVTGSTNTGVSGQVGTGQTSNSGAVSAGTGGTVSSGTGVAVRPAMAPAASVAVTPNTSVAVPSAHLLPGGTMVQHSSTTTLGGPSGDASATKTVVTRYWVNVPAGAERRDDFRRWQSLK